MSVIDWILNLACVLLWLNWRSIRVSAIPLAPGISLLGTLRPADSRRTVRWSYLVALLGILLVRGAFYYQIGPAMNWTPSLELGAVALPFRSDRFVRILLYSFLVLGLWLAGFYAWLLLLSSVNGKVPDTDPLQRLVRLHLGRVEHWPAALKLALIPLLALFFWVGIHSSLVRLGLVPSAHSNFQVWAQAALLGLASVLLWKYFLIALFVLSIADSYIYLGNSPLWRFASTTARNLLRPFRLWPLQLGKLDLSPMVGIILVAAASEGLARLLPGIYQRF